MEREISSGAMLGIVLIALAAIIGLGFAIFAITKGVANDGAVDVQDSLHTVSQQVFLDYDQKVITGQQVISALKSFEGQPVAVLIGTKALQKQGNLAQNHNARVIEVDLPGAQDALLINYNAILALSPGGGDWTSKAEGGKPVGTAKQSGEKLAKFDNGVVINDTNFATVNGAVVYDKDTSGIYKAGNAEYISTSSKFQTYLIKDPSNVILGIVALQL